MYTDFDNYTENTKNVSNYLINLKVKVYKNGDNSQCITVKMSIHNPYKDLKKNIEKHLFGKELKNLRLFNQQGVEINEEDVEFLKPDTTLYASKGEDFDQNSSFSEYDIISQLGEGGFGLVMLGQHKITKEKVAIKIIKAGIMGNASEIDMVFREAEMLKNLIHKNIVIFIMEYLEGGELLDLVNKKGQLSEEDAKYIFKQIVDAINFCHNNKLIHRDLKLENILLTNKEGLEIKVVDFGIAGMCTKFDDSDSDAGSLKYMPPEVFLKLKTGLNFAIDIWAIGVILYGMLFGMLPFNGNNNKQIIEQICSGEYRIIEEEEERIQKEKEILIRSGDKKKSTTKISDNRRGSKKESLIQSKKLSIKMTYPPFSEKPLPKKEEKKIVFSLENSKGKHTKSKPEIPKFTNNAPKVNINIYYEGKK